MIYVVGLGPGNKDYILPITIKIIEKCSIVIGAKRNLEVINDLCMKQIDLSLGFDNIQQYLIKNRTKDIAVVASGDSGFFSLLNFVKRSVDKKFIEVIPGISSLQYMYSKLKKGYESSKFISLHGRTNNIKPFIEDKVELGILTDKKMNNRVIASIIKETECKNIKVHIGERLSYKDEKITTLNINQCLEYEADILSVVVITYE